MPTCTRWTSVFPTIRLKVSASRPVSSSASSTSTRPPLPASWYPRLLFFSTRHGLAERCGRLRMTTRPPCRWAFRSKTSGASCGRRRVSWLWVAGLLWGSKLGVQFSLAFLAFKALPVLILGGFTSIPGAIIGGLIVGATEKLFEVFVGLPFMGGGTENWSPYMLAMIFLLVRPQGLFGEKIIERV